jgi:hypothetical protein
MGKMTKSIIYPALAITFMLLMADFVSFNVISQNNIILHCECPDFSKHSGHSHNHTFEDEVFCNDSHSSQYRPAVSKDSLLSHNLLFTDSYFSKIWQPPKNS